MSTTPWEGSVTNTVWMESAETCTISKLGGVKIDIFGEISSTTSTTPRVGLVANTVRMECKDGSDGVLRNTNS